MFPRTAAPPTLPPAATQQPAGTFLPGTKVQVGSHRVTIEKYLSEGGFAHVYVVRVPAPKASSKQYDLAVLKRVAVPDKDHLASMRTEVETMKKLAGHVKVVTYMDSHASQLKGGGYEVFLLMEYCAGGGLIDFMNTRLQHRLTEPEILKIFGDVGEGVACMHYLKPPLLHRDLKVENVLISKGGGGEAGRGKAAGAETTYKLCDFGSTAAPRPAATTTEEGRLIEEDVLKHTTMQYRSPEMIDVWRKQPIDEKADIWALGVLLYKLCYYTTPFEDVGQMAILNATYKFPAYPSFSERLKKLIASMLKEDPSRRPNIYEVLTEVSSMRGTTVPIPDIYTHRTRSEARRNEVLPTPSASVTSPGAIGLQKVAPMPEVQALPTIAPMRRGRPTAPAQQGAVAAKPGPSPARGDPFAALDSRNVDVRGEAVEELSKRFPSLDEFSIAHGPPQVFGEPALPRNNNHPEANRAVKTNISEPQAEQVFARKPAAAAAAAGERSPTRHSRTPTSQPPPRIGGEASRLALQQPSPRRPGVALYTSTGVGSSPPPPEKAAPRVEVSRRPIWRVPAPATEKENPTPREREREGGHHLRTESQPQRRPGFLSLHRSKSSQQSATPEGKGKAAPATLSSRPSLERGGSSQRGEGGGEGWKAVRQRPASGFVSSDVEFLREREGGGGKRASVDLRRVSGDSRRPSVDLRRGSRAPSAERGEGDEGGMIVGDLDFLRDQEEGGERGRRKSSGHRKRASLPGSMAEGVKSVFGKARLGDAFKRFERDSGDGGERAGDVGAEQGPRVLSPIEGSEHASSPARHPGASEDAEEAIDETEDLPPDIRRELERQRVSQAEQALLLAATESRARGAAPLPLQGATATGGSGGSGGHARASTIQRRVQSLLDEGRQSPVKGRRTAEGYGRYTDAGDDTPPPPRNSSKVATAKMPLFPDQPTMASANANALPYAKVRQSPPGGPVSDAAPLPPPSAPTPPASAPPAQPLTARAQAQARVVARPSVPPKAQALRTGSSARSAQWPPPPVSQQAAAPVGKSVAPVTGGGGGGGGLAALLARDLEGVPDYAPVRTSSIAGAGGARQDGDADGDAVEFRKRFPDLGGMEMVEAEIGVGERER
ncbi:hypothetical protein LTR08_008796 [Meristemomyces frigidus]|nr:hypothetical protein LTR08_008796 [Meristemomyces frigidus]